MILKSVRDNKIKTGFIVTLFVVFIAIFIYFISLLLFEDVYIAVVMGVIFSLASSIGSYYNSDKIVLRLNKAREATREEFLQLNVVLEGLCIAANLPQPKLYVIDSEALNAFATGRNPKNSVICITTGLLNKLDKYELEGVLAHELSHIRNYDILLSTIAIVMVGFVVIISDSITRGLIYHKSDRNSKGNAIIILIGLIFVVLAPIFAELLKLAISRNREYLADASAVELTRNKEGLISALRKLTNDEHELTVNKASASLYIVNPLKKQKAKNSLWSTHPEIENRIAALEGIN